MKELSFKKITKEELIKLKEFAEKAIKMWFKEFDEYSKKNKKIWWMVFKLFMTNEKELKDKFTEVIINEYSKIKEWYREKIVENMFNENIEDARESDKSPESYHLLRQNNLKDIGSELVIWMPYSDHSDKYIKTRFAYTMSISHKYTPQFFQKLLLRLPKYDFSN